MSAGTEQHREHLRNRAQTWGKTSPTPDPQQNGSDGIFLNQAHRDELRASAISHEILSRRGYRTIDPPTNGNHINQDKLLKYFPEWAVKGAGRYPLLYIPICAPNGEKVSAQVRPRTPMIGKNGNKMKYANQDGRALRLDVHPSMTFLSKGTGEAWITEGIKKADSLTSRGLFTVGLIGGVWGWRNAHGTLGEWEQIAIKDREWTICYDSDAHHNNHIRLAMRREGAFLKSRGASKVWYLIVPKEYNGTATKGVDDYFAAGGTLDELKEHRTTKPPADLITDDQYTDLKIAEVIAREALDENYIWIQGMDWLGWNGTVWRPVSDVHVTGAVGKYVRQRVTSAADRMKGDEEGAAAELRGWLKYENAGSLAAAVRLSKSHVEHRVEELDTHRDWLNCPNGVVNLKTGELMPHDPLDLMTKVAGVDHVKGATHPDWTKALEAVPKDALDWYQIRLGQAITGHMTPDDLLIVCQGGGRNGKSTINVTTAKAAGDYFLMASDRILLANPDNHPTELMDLMGTRYVVAEETPEARRLAVARLKKVIGTPTITARKVHKDSVTFDATHSFFLSTNYRPIIEETDTGTWERVALLVFPYRYRKHWQPLEGPNDRVGDFGLRERCKNDPAVLTAAFAWMVEGANKWYAAARYMPEIPKRVQEAAEAWRKESDQVLQYLDDMLEFDPDRHIATQDFLEDLNEWLKAMGHRPWSDKTMVARFGDHSAFAEHQVEKKRVRYDENTISRPGDRARLMNSYPLPKQYTAWLGVKFRSERRPGNLHASSF